MRMELAEFSDKPSWDDYEAVLLAKGFDPYWDAELERKIASAGIRCCDCERMPSYVGMIKGTTALGFLACPPDCGRWMWFVAPTPSTRS
jgi:hypothetical protein